MRKQSGGASSRYAGRPRRVAKAQVSQDAWPTPSRIIRRGVSLAPTVDMILAYANALMANGPSEAAVEQLRRALALDENNLTVRWALAMGHLKVIYASESEAVASRRAFGTSLDELKLWYENTPGIEAPYKAVGTVQPFLLAYQNYNNRDLLKRYGALCATFMAALPRRAPIGQRGDDNTSVSSAARKLRLGIVSAHVREHSIWTAVTKGWVQNLDIGTSSKSSSFIWIALSIEKPKRSRHRWTISTIGRWI